jgi:ABC-type lipoprotein release transport system permease subunit
MHLTWYHTLEWSEKMSTSEPLPQQPENFSQPPIKEKSKRKYLWLLIAVILIVIVAVAVYVVLFSGFNSANGTQITFTSFNEHLVIYPHNTDNTQPVTYDIPLNSFKGNYAVGQQITIQIPYSYQGEIGTENLTSIVCNTSGFSVASVSPELPVQLPNTRDNEEPITLTITFNTPSTPYTGPFDFTVYYDQYL